MEYKKILLIFSMIVIISAPCLVSAELMLNVEYPSTGEDESGITAETTLPQLLKYVFNWFIIIALVGTAISLLYAGVSYLSSAGDPSAMGRARTRLVGSFIGLLILFGSFLILKTLNPTIAVMRLKRVPINTGVVLLDEVAYEVTQSGSISDDQLQKFLDAPAGATTGRAKYLGFSVGDLEAVFGQIKFINSGLDTTKIEKYEGFDPVGLYFLHGANARVSFFSDKYFVSAKGGNDAMGMFTYPDCSSAPCYFNFLDTGTSYLFEYQSVYLGSHRMGTNPGTIQPYDRIVPKSMLVQGIGTGVYLYPYETQVSGGFGSIEAPLYLQGSIENLDYVNFNDKAKSIEIVNCQEVANPEFTGTNDEWKWEKTNDFLAILYDDTYFRGDLRLFLQQISKAGPVVVGGSSNYIAPGNIIMAQECPSQQYSNTILPLQNKPDAFGKVDEASSAQIFDIDKNQKCSILLCAQKAAVSPNGGGEFKDCLAYSTFSDTYTAHMVPQNLKIAVHSGPGGAVTNPSSNDPDAVMNFRNNIKSLQITGNCIVVLFENAVDEDAVKTWIESARPSNDKDAQVCPDCWENDSPGEHSQVFVGPGNWFTLENEPINWCRGSNGGSFWWWKEGSCAQSFAIFPISPDVK